MAYDIEKEVKPILKQLSASLRRDENGNYLSGFLESYKKTTERSESRMKDIVNEMWRSVDKEYFKAFKGQIREEDREDYNEMARNIYRYEIGDYGYSQYNHVIGGKELPEHFDYLKPIDCYEQLYDCLKDFHEACYTLNLDRKTSPSLTKCVFILWAIGDYCDWNDERLILLPWFKKLRNICLRAASAQFDAELELAAPVQAPEPEAEEEKPTPAPQAVEAPAPVQKRGRDWPEDMVFYFEQCYRIFQTSSNRNKKGHRLGPFKIYDEEGRLVTTIPAGQGAVKAVFAYVEENISMLSKGKFVRVPKAAQRQYYNWEKEQTQRF